MTRALVPPARRANQEPSPAGLAITREVFERTASRLHLWPGMPYGALKQMTARGYVGETGAPADAAPGGGKPRFYRLTPLGRRTCAEEAERLARIVDTARAKRMLKGSRGAQGSEGALLSRAAARVSVQLPDEVRRRNGTGVRRREDRRLELIR